MTFSLPSLDGRQVWVKMVNTARHEPPAVDGSTVEVEAHSLMLLRLGAERRIVTSSDTRREPLSPVEQHTL